MSVPDILRPPTASLLREIASHTAITFLSTLAIQATTFVILALAALVLPVEEFARLSLIVAAVMLSSALFELGLDVTSTKMYGDTRDESFLHVAILVRLAIVPFGALIGTAVAIADLPYIGLGIVLGAILNVWNGSRATDLARQDYGSFARSSVIFAMLRGMAGLAALFALNDASSIAAVIYALPVIACLSSGSRKFFSRIRSERRPKLISMLRYGAYVYINAVTFIAVPYVPQFFVASRLTDLEVGTYGLILTFTAPVSLVVYSLRSVLLPKMLGAGAQLEGLMWSGRGFALIIAFALAMALGGSVVACGLDMLYGQSFPQILAAFLVFFIGYSATSAIGFYSLSVHTKGMPALACLVGLVKLVVLVPALLLFGSSLLAIVSITTVAMLLFEIVLVLLLVRVGSS